jgi:hypothetical protein
MVEAGLQHELRGHHHQGHMAMPGGPLPGLVLRHPNMTLGVLEGSLDPETLRLHLRQFGRRPPGPKRWRPARPRSASARWQASTRASRVTGAGEGRPRFPELLRQRFGLRRHRVAEQECRCLPDEVAESQWHVEPVCAHDFNVAVQRPRSHATPPAIQRAESGVDVNRPGDLRGRDPPWEDASRGKHDPS